jgi:hypothetical protein
VKGHGHTVTGAMTEALMNYINYGMEIGECFPYQQESKQSISE